MGNCNEPDYIINDISTFERQLKELEMHIRHAEEAYLNSEAESAKEEKKKVETTLLCLRHGYPLIYIDGFLRAVDACGLRYLKFKLSGKLTKIMPRRGDKDEISLPIKIFEEYVKAVQTNISENFEIYCLFEESEEMEHVSNLWNRISARRKENYSTKELEELLNELREKIEIKSTDYYLVASVKGNNFLIALHQ